MISNLASLYSLTPCKLSPRQTICLSPSASFKKNHFSLKLVDVDIGTGLEKSIEFCEITFAQLAKQTTRI